MIDETLLNNNRRDHVLTSHPISEILPTHFVDTYPKLTRFLELYYQHLHQDGTPTEHIHSLFDTKDINRVDASFLSYLEQQLLMGQSFFRGLDDSRLALKLSNNLYKSKGSKYSLEQFFRMFFGVDAEVVYTKENVFVLNESEIGPESFRYLVNDKLYQTFALLIRTSISTTEWMDVYKQFVHPAGMYVQGEIVIVSDASTFSSGTAMPVALEDSTINVSTILSVADMNGQSTGYVEITGIVPYDEDSVYRIGLQNTVSLYDSVSISDMDKQYNDIREIMTSNSPTWDMDSAAAGGDSATIGMSNTIETMDQNFLTFYDSV